MAIVGGGAAGLAAALFARRHHPRLRVHVLDGAKRLGAKILVSGGGRCNVTNRVVTAADFSGGRPQVVRRILERLPVERTVEFFRELGVRLHEEENGKYFPDTNSARSVLEALLREADRVGVVVLTDHRVTGVARGGEGFEIETMRGSVAARRLVLATGGLSLPKTGSDGVGYTFARRLGHTIVATTPALVPLVLDGVFHAGLSGVSHEAVVSVRVAGERPVVRRGALLWTHFGISGPVALDVSRTWHRAAAERRPATVTLSFLPDDDFHSAERRLLAQAAAHPRVQLQTVLAEWLPARVAEAVARASGVEERTALSQLSRAARRRVLASLLDFPLAVRDSRGYGYAEVTAGGVALEEIDPRTMASRRCSGLYLVGEMLDVDGRIGGFNFQWAWSSGLVAGAALARDATEPGQP